MSLATVTNNILRIAIGLNPEIVKSTVQQAYQYLCAKDFNRLKIRQNLTTVAPYSTGTVAITTAGVVTITTGTFTSSMVGSFMRVYYDDPFFEIASYDAGTGKVTLSNWTGVAVSSGESFEIFKHIYTLDTAFGQLYDVAYQTSLKKKSQHFFDQLDPARTGQSDSPVYWAFAGVSSTTNALKIEVYPVPSSVVSLSLYGKQAYATLTSSSVLLLPEPLIEAAALVDCFRILESLKPGQGWEKRVAAQTGIYAELLSAYEDEDYELGQIQEKVQDTMFGGYYPLDDTFATEHDVD